MDTPARNTFPFASAAAVFAGPWRRSSYSNGGDNCVEVAATTDGRIGVRDSKDPGQVPQIHSRRAWAAFLTGVAGGGFSR
ncbi:MAG: DUF397 domain-containing protein [Pseudonocardiaceae bacterium]